jgi:small subunit ribosomal protein S18
LDTPEHMAPHGKDRSRTKPTDTKNRARRGRPKVCVFCARQIAWVDYKDTDLLRRLMTDRGKIKARANTGTCRQHQRDVALAIKTARELAMLPYLVRTLVADKSGGRRGRDGGRPGDRPPGADDAAAADAGDAEGEGDLASDDRGDADVDVDVAGPDGDAADFSVDEAATLPGR